MDTLGRKLEKNLGDRVDRVIEKGSIRKIVIPFITLLIINNHATSQPETMWQLLQNGDIIRWVYSFGDEFNGTDLDYSKWNDCYEWGCDQNGPNGYFKGGASHRIFDNGVLKLATKYEPDYYEIWHWDQNGNFYTTQEYRKYTSGMIVSKKKFKYGLFEIRFKLPVGKGLWPAFWLYGGSPNEEFDVFEYKGETPNKIHIDMHCPGSNCTNFGYWVTATGNFSDGFNTMMGEWGPNFSFWYLNGQEFEIWFGDLNYQAFLIANMGVANDCPAPFCPGPDNTTALPAYFEIDYIRVWTRLDCERTITISNYSQSLTDPTVITGQDISVTNMTLTSDQSLSLIATNQIVIGPNTSIKGTFQAKIVDCPGPIRKANSIFDNTDTSLLQVISPLSENKNKRNNNNIIDSINKPVLYVKIFPNPSDGLIDIEFEGDIDQNIRIEIFNSLGQPVFLKKTVKEKKLQIDISQFSKGIYYLTGTFDEKTISEKIILQ